MIRKHPTQNNETQDLANSIPLKGSSTRHCFGVDSNGKNNLYNVSLDDNPYDEDAFYDNELSYSFCDIPSDEESFGDNRRSVKKGQTASEYNSANILSAFHHRSTSIDTESLDFNELIGGGDGGLEEGSGISINSCVTANNPIQTPTLGITPSKYTYEQDASEHSSANISPAFGHISKSLETESLHINKLTGCVDGGLEKGSGSSYNSHGSASSPTKNETLGIRASTYE